MIKSILQKKHKRVSNGLYMYRNKIVHGKSYDKFKIKLPSLIVENTERFWNYVVSSIA